MWRIDQNKKGVNGRVKQQQQQWNHIERVSFPNKQANRLINSQNTGNNHRHRVYKYVCVCIMLISRILSDLCGLKPLHSLQEQQPYQY